MKPTDSELRDLVDNAYEKTMQTPITDARIEWVFRGFVTVALIVIGFLLSATLSRIDKRLEQIEVASAQHTTDIAVIKAIGEQTRDRIKGR